MAKDNNSNPKKPKFNTWWIYGLIIAIILGFQLLGSGNLSNQEKTTTSELQEYLRNGDVEKIMIITNARQAKVFLTEEALRKDVHKNVSQKPMFPSTGAIPQYTLDYGDLQNFENEIKKSKTDNNLNTIVDYDTDNNYLMDLLLGILPFAILIGVWISKTV